eukprot:6690707-Alexandrium_andersonii.AAC.1
MGVARGLCSLFPRTGLVSALVGAPRAGAGPRRRSAWCGAPRPCAALGGLRISPIPRVAPLIAALGGWVRA